MGRYNAYQPQGASATNACAFTSKIKAGSWLISDQYGYPIRTHDGFAQFSSKQEAEWAVEYMNRAFSDGEESVQRKLRETLGIAEGES